MSFSKIIKGFSALCLALCVLIWTAVVSSANKTADSYFIEEGSALETADIGNLSFEPESIASASNGEKPCVEATLRLLGVFPVKKVSLNLTNRPETIPGGIPFGIKMLSETVNVVALNSFVCKNELVCPAKEAGIRLGDSIVSINSQTVKSNNDVATLVAKSGGKKLEIVFRRENEQKKVTVRPALDSSDKTYKIGLSVRDSSAGIGTVTFYNPQNSTFGGLGHAVCEAGETALSLSRGSVAIASIDSVTRGAAGSPGRLNGHFVSQVDSGQILINDETGVYGTLENVKSTAEPIEIAFKQEIKVGKATMLTTVKGTDAKEYEIEIEQIALSSDRLTKNMVVRVTDKRLLSTAGGIVQGMSGSPIIQNGRLVGAVTHVFVNDSARGYAIFAENMLNAAKSIPQLKEAS